jgi:hypothetical protein
VVRNYVGEYCTSLEMAGFSLTLIRLDDELTRLLDAPAEIAWRGLLRRAKTYASSITQRNLTAGL